MTENDLNNVSSAFDILLEEMDAEIDNLTRLIAEASEKHAFADARKAIERADQATRLRDKLFNFRRDWEALMPAYPTEEQDAPYEYRSQDEPKSAVPRRYSTRLERGQSTPQSAFNRPILQVLVESGGSAAMQNVLARVEHLMKDTLKELDYHSHASGELRWRTSAQWARNTMKDRGLLKKGSPHGIWEITEAGREALQKGNI